VTPPTQTIHGLDFVSEATVGELTDLLLQEAGDDGAAAGWRCVITPNVDHIVRYHRNEREAAVAARATLVLPDGMPIVWTSRLVGRPLRRRLAGSDLFTVFWPRLGRDGVPTVVVAPSDQVVEGLRADHPVVRGVVPPFFDADDEHQVAAVVGEVVAAADEVAARFVLVLLSMAKCHVLADRLHARWADRPGPVPVVMLLGASADFHVGLVRRAPQWMRRMGLEWLHRLAGDPRRMARRYLVDDPLYAVLVWREWRAAHRRRGAA
jgi:N-acetylglucosaminyldiphosphoundecaprenol N-acetyl-beta-D-mannosaminyltransferase